MPEGDTIFRSAQALRQALQGAAVTAARTTVPQIRALGLSRLVGQTVREVESRGKHLLVWFAPGDLALHTHMMMSGSWHVYRHGERWRKPPRAARFELETAEAVAVCFSAPVCELLSRAQVQRHPSLAALGPDALADPDLTEAARRLDARGDATVGEALLDQRVLAGIGNVYKCELLFMHRVDPAALVRDVAPATRTALLASAVELLEANVAAGAVARTTTRDPSSGGRGQRLFVYGRAGRPCPRCRTPIRVGRFGAQARLTYWCPSCQPPVAPPSPR